MIKTQKTILSIFIALFIVGLSIFIIKKAANKTSNINANSNSSAVSSISTLSSTTLLDEYHEPHLTAQQSAELVSKLHQAANYSSTSDYSLVGDCGTSANATIFRRLHDQRTVQLVNGSYPILRTPNLEHWTKAQSDAFMSDPTVVCGVGFFFPFEVATDYILWRQACSSGVVPTDSSGKLAADFLQCIQAQEVISKEYHLLD